MEVSALDTASGVTQLVVFVLANFTRGRTKTDTLNTPCLKAFLGGSDYSPDTIPAIW